MWRCGLDFLAILSVSQVLPEFGCSPLAEFDWVTFCFRNSSEGSSFHMDIRAAWALGWCHWAQMAHSSKIEGRVRKNILVIGSRWGHNCKRESRREYTEQRHAYLPRERKKKEKWKPNPEVSSAHTVIFINCRIHWWKELTGVIYYLSTASLDSQGTLCTSENDTGEHAVLGNG